MAANLKDLPRRRYTLGEYFALERVGEARYEYWDGEIVCMSGGTRQHAMIASNIHLALGQQVKKGACRAFTGDLPIRTPALPPYRYPDVSVACGKLIFEKVDRIDTLTNPTLIVEVLSPSTEGADRHEKREAYQALDSLQEYLLISQDVPHVTHYVRQGAVWARFDYSVRAMAIPLTSIQGVLSLSDIYDGIDFD
ncbi:MAG: Uma2 family endonuclease [Blastocatellia bacterium]